jgi:hypothetical protein
MSITATGSKVTVGPKLPQMPSSLAGSARERDGLMCRFLIALTLLAFAGMGVFLFAAIYTGEVSRVAPNFDPCLTAAGVDPATLDDACRDDAQRMQVEQNWFGPFHFWADQDMWCYHHLINSFLFPIVFEAGLWQSLVFAWLVEPTEVFFSTLFKLAISGKATSVSAWLHESQTASLLGDIYMDTIGVFMGLMIYHRFRVEMPKGIRGVVRNLFSFPEGNVAGMQFTVKPLSGKLKTVALYVFFMLTNLMGMMVLVLKENRGASSYNLLYYPSVTNFPVGFLVYLVLSIVLINAMIRPDADASRKHLTEQGARKPDALLATLERDFDALRGYVMEFVGFCATGLFAFAGSSYQGLTIAYLFYVAFLIARSGEDERRYALKVIRYYLKHGAKQTRQLIAKHVANLRKIMQRTPKDEGDQ